MPIFPSSEKLQEVLGGFFHMLAERPDIGPQLVKAGLKVKFIYLEPALTITMTPDGEKPNFFFNDNQIKADVEMAMKADTAHKFWMGDLNLVVALARREIKAKGPIPKILKLLPIIKPAYALYPDFIKDKGLHI